MRNLKSTVFCKSISLFLCFFLVFSVYNGYPQSIQVDQTDLTALTSQFNNAKDAYFAEEYETAKRILENLNTTIGDKEEVSVLKGSIALFLGATYEKMGYKILAMKYFCLAKDILGNGKTIAGLELHKLRYYTVSCTTPTGVAVYVLLGQYGEAYSSFFRKDYEGTKVILENLVAEIETLQGWESFKGETYLLLGATYEKLKYKELAIKYYCKAKEILGVGKTIRDLNLKKLKYYKVKCQGVAAVTTAPRVIGKRSGGFGKLIGALLGLAIIGGAVWYLFINKNSPLKKKDDGGTSTYVYRSSCFSTHWEFRIHSSWEGSIGTISLTPENTAPNPTENNNWDDSVTYTLSSSGGGVLKSVSLNMTVKTSGGDNITRNDIILVDNVQKLNKTNSYTQSCTNKTVEHEYKDFFSKSGLGSFTVRHRIVLTNSVGKAVKNLTVFSGMKSIIE